MKNNMENCRNYQTKGLINKDQLTSQVASHYQQQNNLFSLSEQSEQSTLQITTLESQIQTQVADSDNHIYQMELQRCELQKELVNIDVEGEIIVRALIDGKADSLSVTAGQMVNPGDNLLQVIPENTENYCLTLWVLNDAIPYISVGDEVNIRYEVSSVEKFGQFSTMVKTIPRTPASAQEMLAYKGAPQDTPSTSVLWYKIIAMPERQIIRCDEKDLPLENGTKAEDTLLLEKRCIYQRMLSPFYDMEHSATGPLNG